MAAVQERGGVMTLEDLSAHRCEHRDPIMSTYRGYHIYEVAPPTAVSPGFSGPSVIIWVLWPTRLMTNAALSWLQQQTYSGACHIGRGLPGWGWGGGVDGRGGWMGLGGEKAVLHRTGAAVIREQISSLVLCIEWQALVTAVPVLCPPPPKPPCLLRNVIISENAGSSPGWAGEFERGDRLSVEGFAQSHGQLAL